MISQPSIQGKTLLQDLVPFGIGWTLLAILLSGLWWHSEYLEQRKLALARAETAFRLQAAYHLSMMEFEGAPRSSSPIQPGGLARTYKWRSMEHGDLDGRLTSLHSVRSAQPDAWERKALEHMGEGLSQFAEVVKDSGPPRLRFMGVLRMESACVDCHGNSGVAAGKVLGGISLSLPVSTYFGLLGDAPKRLILASFIAGWALVLAAIALARHRQRLALNREHQASDSLLNSEERLREAQRIANMGYWEHDHRTGQIVWSEETFRIFGYVPGSEPPSYDAFMDRVHPEDRVRVAEEFHLHLKEQRPYETEYRVLREDGEVRHVLVSSKTEFDEAGVPLRTLGINLDLTDRRKLDDALQAQAEAHRVLLETSIDGCLEVDEEGRITEVNASYLRLSGYRKEQLLGRSARGLEASDDSGAVRAQTTRIRQKGMDRYETWHLGADGRRIPLQVSVTYLPSRGRFLYFLRDLSAEREARQSLAESEARFSEVFRMIPEVVLLSDLNTGRIIDMNPGFETLSGWKREEVLGRTTTDLGFWQDVALRNELVAELLERGESTVRRIPFLLKNGSTRLGEVHAVRLGAGPSSRALSLVRDVTELERAETLLRASEARFRATFDQASVGLGLLDAEGRILLSNRRLADFLGVEEAALAGVAFPELLDPDHQEGREEYLRQLQAGGANAHRREGRMKRPDGSCAWGRWTTTAIKETDGRLSGFLELVEDISELKERESVALEAEAIAAKGQMAAYVAHEINGPLAGIKSAVELVQSAVPEDHPHRPYVELVRREVDRIAGIVRSLYELHQVTPSQVQDVVVSAVIQDVAALMAPRFRTRQVSLSVDPGERGLRATLRADLLRQVLFNLLLNALEASSAGDEVRCEAAEEGGDLEIRIIDQGPGITENSRERIWEPGFTTKRNAVQGGLGLGLATSRRLLESIHGSIRFESGDGQGTTFFVRIPLRTNPILPDSR